jgi:hypothetical protein
MSAVAQSVVDALLYARDNAASHAKGWGSQAHDQFDDYRGEAARRASTAWDALAGRAPSANPWPAIGLGLLGVAVGWAARGLYQQRAQIAETAAQNLHELSETVEQRVATAKATPGTPLDKAKAAMADPKKL